MDQNPDQTEIKTLPDFRPDPTSDEMFFWQIALCASRLPPKIVDTSWHGHIPFLYLLMRLLQPRSFVELGVYKGASFIAACHAAQLEGGQCRLTGVDTWAGDIHMGDYGGDAVHAELSGYLGAHYPAAELVRATFSTAAKTVGPGCIDLLHIDGLHTYDAVRQDFQTWRDKMSDRGVVLFHDTHIRERGFGVWRYWAELKQQHRSFEFFHTYGLGVLVTGSRLPPDAERLFSLLEGNQAFAELLRAVFEQAGDSLPRRLFDFEQGAAWPAWEKFRVESLAQAARLQADNEDLRRQVAALTLAP